MEAGDGKVFEAGYHEEVEEEQERAREVHQPGMAGEGAEPCADAPEHGGKQQIERHGA